MRRWIGRSAWAVAALVAALGSQAAQAAGAFDAAGPSFLGIWSGEVTQPGRPGTYTVVLTITATGATTDYPAGACTGALRRIGASGEYAFYSEVIAKGKYDARNAPEGCLDGSITLARSGDTVVFHWFGYFDEPMTATGVLRPGAAPALRPPTPPAAAVAASPGGAPTTIVVQAPLAGVAAAEPTESPRRPPFLDPVMDEN